MGKILESSSMAVKVSTDSEPPVIIETEVVELESELKVVED